MTQIPGYWMHETSGVLRPAVERYLPELPLSEADIAALRAYLRQWIAAPAWEGERIAELRRGIDGLTSRLTIDRWLDDALRLGIDPL